MLFHPFGNLCEVLVLLSDIVLFAEVDEVDDRLGCEQEERIDYFNLIIPSDEQWSH